MQSNLWGWVSCAHGRRGSLCPGITWRGEENEPWAQDLMSPPASPTGWCALGGAAPQQHHHLIRLTARKAFIRAGDVNRESQSPHGKSFGEKGILSMTST